MVGGMAGCDAYGAGVGEGISWGWGAGHVSCGFRAAVAVEGRGIGGGRWGSLIVTVAAVGVVGAHRAAEALAFEALACGRV